MAAPSAAPGAPAAVTEPAPGFSPLLEIEENSLAAVSRIYSLLIGNIVRAQTEWFRFLSSRFAKDAETLASLAACKSPTEIAALQTKVGADAFADYAAEAQRIIGVLEKAANETLASAA